MSEFNYKQYLKEGRLFKEEKKKKKKKEKSNTVFPEQYSEYLEDAMIEMDFDSMSEIKNDDKKVKKFFKIMGKNIKSAPDQIKKGYKEITKLPIKDQLRFFSKVEMEI